MATKMLPYKLGSRSASALARGLNVKRIRPHGSYRPSNRTLVINWGNSHPRFDNGNFLNAPSAIQVASNKLSAFKRMKSAGVSVVDFTSDRNIAREWLQDGYKVVCRHMLSSHSGKGIQIIRPGEDVPYAPLYTKYTKKTKEYRLHVFQGRVIDMVEKRKRSGGEVTNDLVRTHSNGWVFCRDYLDVSQDVKASSIKAVESLGLDFGAVDVIWKDGKHYVLEVNTAPGLEGTTLTRYIEAMRSVI